MNNIFGNSWLDDFGQFQNGRCCLPESIAGITFYQEGNTGELHAVSSFKIIVFLSIIYRHLGQYIDKYFLAKSEH